MSLIELDFTLSVPRSETLKKESCICHHFAWHFSILGSSVTQMGSSSVLDDSQIDPKPEVEHLATARLLPKEKLK